MKINMCEFQLNILPGLREIFILIRWGANFPYLNNGIKRGLLSLLFWKFAVQMPRGWLCKYIDGNG